MSRNRRRSRDRRQPSEPSIGAARAASAAPEAIEHAAPDVELAAAQVALGRPELSEAPEPEQLEAFEEEQAGRRGRRGAGERTGAAVEHHGPGESLPSRFTGFLRGCWRELQRVQWPDRRQVMQATGVVLGFVIVAGAFLGVADLVSSKVVNFILTR